MEDPNEETPKYQPKGGRRRRGPNDTPEATKAPEAAPHTKKGWGDDLSGGGAGNNASDTYTAPSHIVEDTVDTDASAAIPSLEPDPAPKEEEVNLAMVVASAPAYRQVMPQLLELERGQVRLPPLRGVEFDLSVLVGAFISNVEDEDVEWVPEQLFVQVMSDVQAEKDLLAPLNDMEKDTGGAM
eukprot:PhF_6_TR21018/c0_g1_i1/m.30209/K19675/IFT43; intraflagellar transport protein 43